MVRSNKVPVTTRAVLQRINRRLGADDEMVKKSRGAGAYALGDYYRIDVAKNFVVEKHVDPEALARRLGVLADYEALQD